MFELLIESNCLCFAPMIGSPIRHIFQKTTEHTTQNIPKKHIHYLEEQNYTHLMKLPNYNFQNDSKKKDQRLF